MKKRKILLTILVGAIFLCAIVGGTVYYYLFAPQFHPSRTVYIPDAMLFARMTMYTMCIAVSPEAIKSL